jgi:hypothetical protein
MKQWYYAQHGERKGPVDASTVLQLYRAGHILPSDLVWEDGMPDWIKAVDVLPPAAAISPSDTQQHIPPPPPYQPSPGVSRLPIVALVTGILSLLGLLCCCCGILGIVPVITGHLALNEIKRNAVLSAGTGLAQAGLIMGYVSLGISLLFLLAHVVIIALAIISELN